MNPNFYFAQGVRVANFTTIDLPVKYKLDFNNEEKDFIVKEIRKYADLPYVFVISKAQSEKILAILSILRSIRSRCYPYAVFMLDGKSLEGDTDDVDVIKTDDVTGRGIANQIDAYIASRFQIDESQLKILREDAPPETVDVVVVGAGITGLYAANRIKGSGRSVCILDKRKKTGGIWSRYANVTSRVNTSEGAYRLVENPIRSNRDHSATREVLEDIALLTQQLGKDLFLNTEVRRIERTAKGYLTHYGDADNPSVIESKGVILAINDRVGPPREIEWPDQSRFQGEVVTGFSDKTKDVNWQNKKVVVVGMGAFAIENVRTALEGGARHVTVLCRRHGTICPKIIDYLNFSTPYDEDFKHDKKSNIRNMMNWKKLYDLSGATQPECWMGKVKHPGHTISVSDIWFIAHYLNKAETVTGSIAGMYAEGVITDKQERIDADIVVNCIGFERNASAAKALSGYAETYNTNYLDKDFMYLADAYIDDDAFNSFFGSSVLEMVKFYMEVYLKFFDSPYYDEMIKLDGIEKVSIEDRRWTHYIKGAAVLIQNDPDLRKIARNQVEQRTHNFIEQHDLATYISENKREWIDLHSFLAGKPMTESDCLPYVFDKLLST